MKNIKFYGLVCILTGSLVLTTPVHAEIQNTDKVLNDAKKEYEETNEATVETKIYKSTDEYKNILDDYQISKNQNINICDLVIVNGSGSNNSYELSETTKYYNDKIMAVVGYKSNNEYPYALATLSENLEIKGIVGWFKKENIKKIDVSVNITKHCDVVKEVIYTTQASIDYDPETESWYPVMCAPIGYEFLGDRYAIKTYYQQPEPMEDYKWFYQSDKISNGVYEWQYVDKDDNRYTYYIDVNKGIFYTKDNNFKLDKDKNVLSKRFNIINN